MRTHFLKKALLGSISALVILPAGAASAQQLDEVIVTARRTAENVMTVPIAITAVTAKAVEQRGITDVITLSAFTPGMFANTADVGSGHMDRRTRHISFRGLTTDSSQASIFIDGAPYGGSGEPLIADIERVEVLKGPQSVYFGRSTFAGAINYVTKDPTKELTGQVSQELYTYGGVISQASASGAVIPDKLSFRAAVRHYSFGGYYKDGVDGQSLGKNLTDSGTISLLATPIDHLKIRAYFSYARDHDGPPVEANIKTSGPGVILNQQLGGTGGKYWTGPLPDLGAIQSAPQNISCECTVDAIATKELLQNARGYPLSFDPTGTDFGLHRIIKTANLRTDYDFESGWSIGSIISYDQTKYNLLIDQVDRDVGAIANPLYPTPAALATACATGAAACFIPPFIRHTALYMDILNDFSAEARITSPQNKPVRATLGANLFTSQDEGMTNFNIRDNGRNNNSRIKTTAYTPAIFGGVYADITPKLKLSLEGRYQWDRIGSAQLFPTFGPPVKQTYTSFSPRASIDYKVTPDQMFYATFSRGYRPGGFNTALQGLTASDITALHAIGVITNLGYDQEVLNNYELGLKGTWLDKRVRTEIAAYYMTWRNGQVTNNVNFQSSTGNRSFSVIQNVGSVDLKGAEFELDALLTRKISINASLNLERPVYKAYIYAPKGLLIHNSTNVTGNTLEQTPQAIWAISPEYKDHLNEQWDWYARIDYTHRGRVYIDATNVAWLKARNVFDFRAGLSKGPLNFDFYVKNLFNNKQLTEAVEGQDQEFSASTTCPPCYTDANPPGVLGLAVLNEIRLGLPQLRTVGVKASYNF